MRYAFGQYVLDTKRRELRGPAGPVALRPKVFGLLAYLIANRERVVSKQELFDRLWQGLHVGDATLNTCVKATRRAVGDSGSTQAVIRTLHGHGYRFVAAVEEQPEGEVAANVSPPAGRGAAQGVAVDTEGQGEPGPGSGGERPVPRGSLPSGKEHKQVTVLHGVLSDAAPLAAMLGPEAMDEVMERFLDTAGRVVARYGGTTTQRLSDGLIALFGAPQAYEDHARRAVSAALELQAELAGASGRTRPVSAKIGLHTGSVVVGFVGDAADQVYTAVGRTTETARLLQQAAPSGTVVVSRETHRLVRSEVKAESFAYQAADIPEAPSAYLIRALTARRAGVPRPGGRLLSRFVGRDRELAMLRECLHQLADTGGQAVSISGEPGIGKSRLVDEFERSQAPGSVRFLRTNCLAYGQTTPYQPIAHLLREICGIKSSDRPQQAMPKVRACLRDAGVDAADAEPLLCQLLGLPADDATLDRLSPEERRVLTFGYLHAIVLHLAEPGPCVVLVEDLHWIDATSEAWLTSLVHRLAVVRLLLLATHRPGYQAPWLQQSSATQLALLKLAREDSTALVRSLPPTAQLSEDAVRRIVEQGAGNPFFLEELAQALVADPAGPVTVPDTVQAVLAARIDQLAAPDKRLLQVASVVGTDVPASLLQAVDDLTEAERRECLERLQYVEFLYERQTAPERVVSFKHALAQNAAYATLLKSTREQLHVRIAETLEANFVERTASQPELLAHHYTAGGLVERAIPYWHRAGRQASERSAIQEAVAHLTKATELLSELPRKPSVVRQELEIYMALGPALMSAKGWGTSEVEATCLRARELCAEVGSKAQLFTVTWGMWLYYQQSGQGKKAKPLAKELMVLVQDSEDSGLLLQAHHAGWTTEFRHGSLRASLGHAEKGMGIYRPAEHRSHTFLYGGHDPGMCCLATSALALWFLGYPDQALDRANKAVHVAEQMGHTFSIAFAQFHVVQIHQLRREFDPTLAMTREMARISEEHGFTALITAGAVFRGWALAALEETDRGIDLLSRYVRRWRDSGAELRMAQFLWFLADAYLALGTRKRGLAAADEALRFVRKTGEIRWRSEIYRVKGELLLCEPGQDGSAAEDCFKSALADAREHGAKAPELRAATSLARLLHRQGRSDQARELLAPVYGWFTEGFETSDLRAARSLLDDLQAR